MKVARIVGHRKFEVIDVKMPDLTDQPEGMIIYKSECAAVCGSDIPSFVLPQNYPLPIAFPNHECVGTIVESKSKHFKPGDLVLATQPGEGARGLAEYVLTYDHKTVRIPNFDPKDQILMSQPLGTVLHACRKLGSLLNLDVIVLGQGPMGLLWSHTLANLGARKIIAVDPLDYRLDVSQKMFATHTINSEKEDLVKSIAEITDGKMADLVIEVVGHQTDTINTCIDLVKRNGKILAFGVPDDPNYNIRYKDLFYKNIRLICSVGPEIQIDYPLAIDWIAQNRINVAPIITHHLPFDQVQRAYEIFTDRKDHAIKVIIDF